MFDSITTEEEYVTTTTTKVLSTPSSNAINSIVTQMSSFASVAKNDEYESIGSYEDNTPSVKSMTLTTNLESGEYESLEEWLPAAASVSIEASRQPVERMEKLVLASVLIQSKNEPSSITELRCRHHRREEEKAEKKREKKEKKTKREDTRALEIKSLADLVPIATRIMPSLVTVEKKSIDSSSAITTTTPLAARPMPRLITLQSNDRQFDMRALRKNATTSALGEALAQNKLSASFKSTLMGDTPLASHQLLPMIPLQKRKEAEASSFKTQLPMIPLQKRQQSSTSFASPVVLPTLKPLQKRSTLLGAPVTTIHASDASMPQLLTIQSKKNINSMKDLIGSSFFGANTPSPFGAALGASNKFDLGCGMKANPLKCPRTYLEKNRNDLYKLWQAYDMVPVLGANKALFVVVPSKDALAATLASLDTNEQAVRDYLQSHILTVLASDVDALSPDSSKSVETLLPSFEVKITQDKFSQKSLVVGEPDEKNYIEIPLYDITPHAQIRMMQDGFDFKPSDYTKTTTDEETTSLDGMMGNLKKKILIKTGLKKEVIVPRKYEDLVYREGTNDDSFLQLFDSDRVKQEIKVKVETHTKANVNRSTATLSDPKPAAIYDGRATMKRTGSLKPGGDESYRYVILMNGSSITLPRVFESGVAVTLRDTVSRSSSKKIETGHVMLPYILKTEKLLFAFDHSKEALDDLKNDNKEAKHFISFESKFSRSNVRAKCQLVFRRNGPCNKKEVFSPTSQSCGYELFYIIMDFKKENLIQMFDYNRSFFASSYVKDDSVLSDSFDAKGGMRKKMKKMRKKRKDKKRSKKESKDVDAHLSSSSYSYSSSSSSESESELSDSFDAKGGIGKKMKKMKKKRKDKKESKDVDAHLSSSSDSDSFDGKLGLKKKLKKIKHKKSKSSSSSSSSDDDDDSTLYSSSSSESSSFGGDTKSDKKRRKKDKRKKRRHHRHHNKDIKPESTSNVYATLTYNMAEGNRWGGINLDEVIDLTFSNENNINLQIRTLETVDRQAHTLSENTPGGGYLTKGKVPVIKNNEKGSFIFTLPLEDKYIRLSTVIEKGLALKLQEDDNESPTKILPAILNKNELLFAFNNTTGNRTLLKSAILAQHNEFGKGNIGGDADKPIVFKADGVEMPHIGRGTYYFVFKRYSCAEDKASSTSTPLGPCEYSLAYIRMIFNKYDLTRGVDFSKVAFSNAFEECLYNEMIQPSSDLASTLTAVEKRNKFSDFVSMNGATKLVTELAKETKASEYASRSVSGVTRAYKSDNLHSVLYDMNVAHLPLKKQEVNSKALEMIDSIQQRAGFGNANESEKQRMMANLCGAINTFNKSIVSIRALQG